MQDQTMIIKERMNSVMRMVQASSLAGQVHVEEGKIRIAKPIKNSQGQYTFDIKNDAVDNLVTFGLDRNDVFIPARWAFLVAIKNKNTRVEQLYTFIPQNDGVNPSVYAKGFVDDQLKALYDGYVQWTLDNTVVYSRYPMEKFYKVPETQGAFVLKSDDTAVNEGIQLERRLDSDLELMYPRFIIAGTRDHKITVNFDAAGLTFALNDPTNYEAELVMYMDGFLIKGGCQNGDRSPFGDVVGNW